MIEPVKSPYIVIKLDNLTTEDLNVCIPDGYELHQIIHDTIRNVWNVVVMHCPPPTVYRFDEDGEVTEVFAIDDDDEDDEPKFKN